MSNITEIVDRLIKGREIFEEAVGHLDPIISGEPMSSWTKKFKIKIPTDNLSPGILQNIAMQLMDLHQEATFLSLLAEAKKQYLHHGNEIAYHSEYMGLYESFEQSGKKKPAASTLESMTKVSTQNIESAMLHADIETKFFKNILEHLGMCRRLIENATINLSVELKQLNSDKYFDSLNRKVTNYGE